MKSTNRYTLSLFIIAICSILLILGYPANAQRRDNLTDKEIELIRDAQELDRRMEVYVKAIERRFLVIDKDESQAKQIEKDVDKWGELPKGSKSELFDDIKKILQEAIDKIDDVAENDSKSLLISPAIHTLADASKRFMPKLQSYTETTEDKKNSGSIYQSIEFCKQIIEASENIPHLDRKGKPLKKEKG